MKSSESRQPRILMIDDDADLRALLVRKFASTDVLLDQAEDIRTAKQMLYTYDYDLIILDLIMHPEPGYVLFEFLKEQPKFSWIPLIVLSGQDDYMEKVRCLRSGADDYVTKPFHFEELKARMLRLLRRSEQYERLAFRDGLTGVFNRRYFDNQLELELQRVDRFEQPLSVALIDVDHFKSINDTYGHPVGDIVLQQLSVFIQERLRQTDLLARYGGEEFVIAFMNTSALDAAQVVLELLEKLRHQHVAVVDGKELRVTFSAGVAQWRKGQTRQEWLKQADELLYRAKEKGRSRVEI
jgi:two-component system, cell cycle response regulator